VCVCHCVFVCSYVISFIYIISCGKTHLANSIAGQLNIPYFRVSSPELVSGMSGESEARIRELFQAASDSAPAIVFMDELDAIAPKRSDGGSSRGMEKRMVAQLLTCLDMLHPKNNRQGATVIVMGATNRPDSIDPALRRAGRFDKEILMGVPDEEARIGILRTMTKTMKVSGDFDLKVLARMTPGYVGADIRSLTKEAAAIAINRIFKEQLNDQRLPSDMIDDDNDVALPPVNPLTTEEMEFLHITMQDFLEAIPHVQPSSKREGFATVPDVSWDEIGALSSVREELTLSVLEPIRNPEKFKALGIPLPAGVMLYGPPGCGKTLLAKAIANESGANFISVKGPELLDKYVGESERSVRLVFERARASAPCVVFFDELDSLCPKRGGDGGGGGVSERVVNQLLTEMDGLESRRSVFVIGATNRPELIDPAMMRP
jgi:ribosome biogenesis ATPase